MDTTEGNGVDNETARHARRVAEAADAWLSDPRDTQTYQRLVDATIAWRHLVQPMLEGTESAGRRSLPIADLFPVPAPEAPVPGAPTLDARVLDGPPGPERDDPLDEPPTEPAHRQPQRLDLLLGSLADELRARTETPT